jgi:hypothetical protein
MSQIASHVFPYVVGIGSILGGTLMLVRPELCRGAPPDPTLTPRGIRTGGLVLLFFGILWLWTVLMYGLVPCGPSECLDF